MNWRDNLRKASFRGVEFKYADTDGEYGRRHARHEYPGRDVPFLEDMGRKTREHTIQAYVLEPDHLGKAKLLREACEKPGPGTLVHPYLGEMQVACPGCRQRFTTRDGGMAIFTLTFVESGDNRYPKTQPDTQAAVNRAANEALTAVKLDFQEAFSVDGWPGFIADEAASVTGLAADDIESSIKGSISAGENLASFVRDVTSLKAEVDSFVQNPQALADGLADLVGKPAALDSGSLNTVFTPLSTFGTDLGTVPQTTATRQRQATNQTALTGLVRRLGMIERIRAVASETFITRMDAVTARDTLSDMIDDESETAPHTTYQSMASLKAALVKHVSAVAPSLPRVIEHVSATTRPALVIANELYGDNSDEISGRATEIASRNGLRHPAMAPGGDALEVLSHG